MEMEEQNGASKFRLIKIVLSAPTTDAWEAWARKKINGICWDPKRNRCIPLRGDPACRMCFEAAKEENEKDIFN
jgi:hypothetical protein